MCVFLSLRFSCLAFFCSTVAFGEFVDGGDELFPELLVVVQQLRHELNKNLRIEAARLLLRGQP
ncbi:MAG: hypothetical protein HY815_02690 [Candidatus Riflebacteria bacterium]|nr:hypothetical protein [Candidatus Riflebacteria bacterium]